MLAVTVEISRSQKGSLGGLLTGPSDLVMTSAGLRRATSVPSVSNEERLGYSCEKKVTIESQILKLNKSKATSEVRRMKFNNDCKSQMQTLFVLGGREAEGSGMRGRQRFDSKSVRLAIDLKNRLGVAD
jgi:hypothetical protein